MTDSAVGVRITLREVYDRVEQMDRRFERLVIAVEDLADHETRLRVIELNQAAISSEHISMKDDIKGIRSTVGRVVIGVLIVLLGAIAGAVFTIALR